MTQDDETPRKHLVAELDFDPSLEATHITVAVHDGVVTLTGQVASLAQKEAARAAVARVRGARAIAQEICVTPPQDPRATLSWPSAHPAS